MADDKNMSMNIEIEATANEQKIKKTSKRVVDTVDSVIKDGRIEIPIDITIPISNKKLSKAQKTKIAKAQKDVTDTISKMMSKGFSASGEDIDKLNNKLQKLIDTTDRYGIGHQNKTLKEIRKQAKAIEKSYQDISKVEKKRKRKSSKFDLPSDEEINNAIKKENARQAKIKAKNDNIDKKYIKHLSRGANRGKAAEVGAETNLGYRGPIMDIQDKRALRATARVGPFYGTSDLMKQAGESNELNRKFPVQRWTAAIGTIDKMIEASYKRGMAIKRQITDYEKNGEVKIRYEDSEVYSSKPRSLTPAEKAKGYVSTILPSLAAELKNIIKNDEDDNLDRFKQIQDAILSLNTTAGTKTIKAVTSILDMSLHRWFGNKGYFDVGDGTNKIDQTREKNIENALKDMLDHMGKLQKKIIEETIALEELNEPIKQAGKNVVKISGIAENSIANRLINNIAAQNSGQNQKLDEVVKATNNSTKATVRQTNNDMIENSAKRVADRTAGVKTSTLIRDVENDSDTGFNSDSKADRLLQTVFEIKDKIGNQIKPLSKDVKPIVLPSKANDLYKKLESATRLALPKPDGRRKKISDGLIPELNKSTKEFALVEQKMTKALTVIPNEFTKTLKESVYPSVLDIRKKINIPEKTDDDTMLRHLAYLSNIRKGKNIDPLGPISFEKPISPSYGELPLSEITTSIKDPAKWWIRLQDAITDLIGTTANYKKIIRATSEEQAKLSAEQIKKYGFARGREGLGDKISMARSMSLWRGTDKFERFFKDLKITKGIEIDTTKVTDKLAKVLSGKQMRNAQMGGSPLRNLIGYGTGFIGMPSLEKSRAGADALNQINAIIREEMNKVVNDIQGKEQTLTGMKERGELRLGKDGTVLESSTVEAKTLAAELENSKLILDSILADMGMVDDTIDKSHGKISSIMKQLSFTSPVLLKNNDIIANINAGYDKNGKALKFQTRTAEILSYTFQLMSRHIGQMIKNWALMLNPINLVKRAFNDFTSYDVKWQRTMNVIKYNLRRIIRPFMQWLAQQLVNIIGLVNAIIKGIGQAFGKDWDLFDKSAASAEQMREELEQAANVTASFDELHDIGGESSGNAAADLMGDIYTPEWGNLYDTITKSAKAITEKLIPIFKKLGEVLQWCLKNWKALVGAFLAFTIAKALWDLLKWALGLKEVLGAIGITSFTGLLSALSLVAGAIISIKAIWDSIKWAKDWGKMLPSERLEKGDKNVKEGELGGALLGAGIGGKIGSAVGGGPIGWAVGTALGTMIGDGMGEAAIGTFNTAISTWHGDTEGTKHYAEKAGEGVGKIIGTSAGAIGGVVLSAKIGAVLGTTLGPVGTAVGTVLGGAIGYVAGGPIGKAIGSVYGDLINGLQTITRGKGDFQKLKVSADDVTNSLQLASEKTQTWNSELETLTMLEQQTGESGRSLYESVENGTRSYWGLTEAQKEVYNQYQNVITAEQQMNEARKQSMEYSAKQAEQLGKESGDFKQYIAIMQDAMNQGVISQEEMYDYFAQTYGKLDSESKKLFIDQIPSYMRESVVQQGIEYETFGNKIHTFFTVLFDVTKGFIEKIIHKIADVITIIQEKWTNFKQGFKIGWEASWNVIIGWINTLWEKITGLFDNIGKAAERLWQRVCNFFSGKGFKTNEQVDSNGNRNVSIQAYATGTNYVPANGLAYLHQGEAVIPAKYNKPYTNDNSRVENAIYELTKQVSQISNKVDEGIAVKGQFVQKGSDLVATVEKANNKLSNNILNNRVYAR